MKLDFGHVAFALPSGDGMMPTLALATGRVDRRAGANIGPTVARGKDVQFPRTLAASFTPVRTSVGAAVEEAVAGLTKAMRAKDVRRSNRVVAGRDATLLEARHLHRDGTPVVTCALIWPNEDMVAKLALTCLDEPGAVDGARRQFDSICDSLTVGGMGAPEGLPVQ
jgi:hypothetical protein